jgi:hypothetical protein
METTAAGEGKAGVQAASPALIVDEGRLLTYRIFDVGDEIELDVAARLVNERREGQRPRLAREKGQGLLFTTPPLDVDLGRCTLALPAPFVPCQASLSARLYDYGAVSMRFEIPIDRGTDLETLLPLCDHLYDSPAVDAVARQKLDAFLPEVGRALVGAHVVDVLETYTVVLVQSLRGAPTAKEVLAAPVLPKLLLGETGKGALSDGEREDVLRHAQSYFDGDLAVIDWNSAFVLEPSGSRDIPDLVEFANSQLLELRYYDGLLDLELARIYDDFAAARRSPLRLLWSPYGRLARAVLQRVVEVNELTERVDNALKVVGDFYLARVYQGAVRRLRIPDWQSSIDRKQALVAQAYELLKGEVEIRRSTTMELVVIVLILAELVAALRGAH